MICWKWALLRSMWIKRINGGNKLILEYVDDFTSVRGRWCNNKKLFSKFEKYCIQEDVELENLDKHINSFVNGLSIACSTRCSYRAVLRALIKFIYSTEGLGLVKEQDLDYEGERYLLKKDGSYYRID